MVLFQLCLTASKCTVSILTIVKPTEDLVQYLGGREGDDDGVVLVRAGTAGGLMPPRDEVVLVMVD